MMRSKGTPKPTRGVADLVQFAENYLVALRALRSAVEPAQQPQIPSVAAVGPTVIWPCTDGAVVLIEADREQRIRVLSKSPTGLSINRFIREHPAFAFVGPDGKPTKLRAILQFEDASHVILDFADAIIQGPEGVFRSRHAKGWVVGWDAIWPHSADQHALSDFRTAFAHRNLAGAAALLTSGKATAEVAFARGEALLRELRQLLASATTEEELQIFIRKHPEVLYPDFVTCHSKLPLGSEFVTDFVVLVQAQQGQEYVFCEIEHPSKPIFTSAGQFSNEFTQAKNQLLDWDTWLTNNHAYIRTRLQRLNKPYFHLVMGRSTGLTSSHRAKLDNEFAGTMRRFSTYDDLADRLEQMLRVLLRAP